jgi:adenine phosphoribosyltransferase
VPTLSIDYHLEYGADRLEIDPGAIQPGQRVVLVDDLVATGGTARAAAELLRKAGAVVEAAVFVIDLPDLGGARSLGEIAVETHALMAFPGH